MKQTPQNKNNPATVPVHVLQTANRYRLGTVENHGKKWLKNTPQNCVKIAKITAKTRHQITGPNTIVQSIKLNI